MIFFCVFVGYWWLIWFGLVSCVFAFIVNYFVLLIIVSWLLVMIVLFFDSLAGLLLVLVCVVYCLLFGLRCCLVVCVDLVGFSVAFGF